MEHLTVPQTGSSHLFLYSNFWISAGLDFFGSMSYIFHCPLWNIHKDELIVENRCNAVTLPQISQWRVQIQTYKMINSHFGMKRNLQNDKLVMKIIRKQTCKMITQDYDKSVSKKQESDQKWLIIFLGKVCTRNDESLI